MEQLKIKIKVFLVSGKPWYKKWWLMLIVCGVAIIPLIIINCVYMKGLELNKQNTVLSASDWVLFYGSFLSFLGTVCLGGLALKQNNDFKQENDKLKKIEMAKYASIPLLKDAIVINDISVKGEIIFGISQNKSNPNLRYSNEPIKYSFSIINSSIYPIVKTTFRQLQYGLHEDKYIQKGKYIAVDTYIGSEECYNYNIKITPIWKSYLRNFTDARKDETKLELVFENIFGFQTISEILLYKNKENIYRLKAFSCNVTKE